MKRLLLVTIFSIGGVIFPSISFASGAIAGDIDFGSVTNTCYIQSVTTTVTGNGWIDCRGATSITFTVQTTLKTDAAVHVGAGVTIYADGSGELQGNLPNTNSQPFWNNTILGTPFQTNTARTFTIDTPPSAVRVRWHGAPVSPGPTMTVMYTINFGSGGIALTEAGPTPSAHW